MFLYDVVCTSFHEYVYTYFHYKCDNSDAIKIFIKIIFQVTKPNRYPDINSEDIRPYDPIKKR